jgi:hypothetical protein
MRDHWGKLLGDDCGNRKMKDLAYVVPGPWLPHRKFTVTYNSFDDIKVEEK